MAAELKIDVAFDIREEEADGSDCRACGDQIFLKGYRIVVLFFGQVAWTKLKLCQSCAPEFRKHLRGELGEDGENF